MIHRSQQVTQKNANVFVMAAQRRYDSRDPVLHTKSRSRQRRKKIASDVKNNDPSIGKDRAECCRMPSSDSLMECPAGRQASKSGRRTLSPRDSQIRPAKRHRSGQSKRRKPDHAGSRSYRQSSAPSQSNVWGSRGGQRLQVRNKESGEGWRPGGQASSERRIGPKFTRGTR